MELPIFKTYMNFSCHHFCCFAMFLYLFWISLCLKNRCLQHPWFQNLCKIAQASKISASNAQHFLSDLLTHSWFHSMLFALPGYQFPYTVTNRCLYLRSAVKLGQPIKLACLEASARRRRSTLTGWKLTCIIGTRGAIPVSTQVVDITPRTGPTHSATWRASREYLPGSDWGPGRQGACLCGMVFWSHGWYLWTTGGSPSYITYMLRLPIIYTLMSHFSLRLLL